jgi:hypothetical protein
MMSRPDKTTWQTPTLSRLDVSKTLTGPVLADQEATFQQIDLELAGPKRLS